MKITLYHSSNQVIPHPDVSFSREYLDFGRGFYLTTLKEQAEAYGQRFLRRGQPAWVNTYEIEYLSEQWNVLVFEAYDKEWLELVSRCRGGLDDYSFDLIIGGIANDKVIQTLDRYFLKEITEDAALGLLKYEKPNNQFCIRSQQLIDNCLRFVKGERL